MSRPTRSDETHRAQGSHHVSMNGSVDQVNRNRRQAQKRGNTHHPDLRVDTNVGQDSYDFSGGRVHLNDIDEYTDDRTGKTRLPFAPPEAFTPQRMTHDAFGAPIRSAPPRLSDRGFSSYSPQSRQNVAQEPSSAHVHGRHDRIQRYDGIDIPEHPNRRIQPDASAREYRSARSSPVGNPGFTDFDQLIPASAAPPPSSQKSGKSVKRALSSLGHKLQRMTSSRRKAAPGNRDV
ncbi:hypothetical protein GGR57DRAFT_499606 [Xylariaceae sp. FL1272]|nr:hypothetical protein GGR57DRAFT_499606 [Xylariaceae sp. FL1272]